jgi:hypothetical protein
MSKQQDIFAEFLKTISDRHPESNEEKNYGEEYLTQLKSACRNYLQKESFEVGQIVKWKENLKNRKLPHNNQPAIVIAVLDEPVIHTDDESGSPYFLENLDIILGIILDDGTFLSFYYDSRRFKAY